MDGLLVWNRLRIFHGWLGLRLPGHFGALRLLVLGWAYTAVLLVVRRVCCYKATLGAGQRACLAFFHLQVLKPLLLGICFPIRRRGAGQFALVVGGVFSRPDDFLPELLQGWLPWAGALRLLGLQLQEGPFGIGVEAQALWIEALQSAEVFGGRPAQGHVCLPFLFDRRIQPGMHAFVVGGSLTLVDCDGLG